MRSISQRELRNSSGQVLRDLAAGEELMVTSNGEPIGVLRMDPPPTERRRVVSPEQYAAVMGDVPTLTPDQQRAWLEDSRTDDEGCDPWTPA
ncbi:type II toxin-antitoxin system prevent-host-death family antitoxin [Pseudokineococcus marinus]|uniref:Type II toxin-antitoxin system prevent-host-death family antitoxin n=1 Tax=Pseudokineococcus marinus TaxID=351215 RepID=A0A849BER7_9ACTN|nr:type II toxin-antitoxin system prevent-host-death family antitoxin [Pseudokineococcus marinus]NNH21540.1 type II toxin-antitoxin system prevent-host-death family antitoxin [Pseudokineococcus marinus]